VTWQRTESTIPENFVPALLIECSPPGTDITIPDTPKQEILFGNHSYLIAGRSNNCDYTLKHGNSEIKVYAHLYKTKLTISVAGFVTEKYEPGVTYLTVDKNVTHDVPFIFDIKDPDSIVKIKELLRYYLN